MTLYQWFLLFTGIELLGEVGLSIRNSRKLIEAGAVPIAEFGLPLMAAIYAGMYLGSYYENSMIVVAIPAAVRWAFLGVYVAAKALKFWAIASLGKFWTMRVLVVPGTRTVSKGPYRLVRHPNYVAVAMEMAGTTLTGGAVITFAISAFLFTLVLVGRIRSEENALLHYTDYSQNMSSKRRFLP